MSEISYGGIRAVIARQAQTHSHPHANRGYSTVDSSMPGSIR
jgi:hypothetical protein